MLRDWVKEAAAKIKQGGLVAFPTETVYGLGGDALNPATVEKIYSAKGRPGDNPLIVHVANQGDFWALTQDAPDYAGHIVREFWPGPVTLVARKSPLLPSWVGVHPGMATETIAVRMPSHPIALELIEASGCHIAAPSANKSGRPSPTSARHVFDDFPDAAALGIDILDGGHTTVGLESTVVDVTGEFPVVLRPGSVTAQALENAVEKRVAVSHGKPSPLSPGTMYKHYAPKAPLTIVVGNSSDVADFLMQEAASPKIGALVLPDTFGRLDGKTRNTAELIVASDKPELFAKNLYTWLRAFDSLDADRLFAEGMATDGIGYAIMDRMHKAAEGRVLIV